MWWNGLQDHETVRQIIRYSIVAFSDGNAFLITDAIIVSTVEQLASTKSRSTLEEQYSFPEVVSALVNFIRFLSSDYRDAALS